MFKHLKKTKPRDIITPAEEDEIILNYLKQCAPSYKDQDITAEQMIEMEIDLIERRRYLHS